MAYGWVQSGLMGKSRGSWGRFLADDILFLASLPFFLPKTEGKPIYSDDALMCGIHGFYPQYRFYLHVLPVSVV